MNNKILNSSKTIYFIVLVLLFTNFYHLIRLGNDEFSRSYLSTFFISTFFSIGRGLVMSLALLAVSGFIVYVMEIRNNNGIKVIIKVLTDALESIHIYAWILLVAGIYENNVFIITLFFIIAGLPLVINILSGNVRVITGQEYYKAAIALGLNDFHLVFTHVIPNLRESLISLGINIFGTAIAVYGATAIFGAVNRQELDLGIFLLRGKEQAPEDIGLLLATISMYAIIYSLLLVMKGKVTDKI